MTCPISVGVYLITYKVSPIFCRAECVLVQSWRLYRGVTVSVSLYNSPLCSVVHICGELVELASGISGDFFSVASEINESCYVINYHS